MQLCPRRFHLTVIRHGQTVANATGNVQGHSNTPLTNLGIQQAMALAHHFKSIGWTFDRIYSSDLGRARDTAKLIASICGRDGTGRVIEDVRLRERKYGPRFEGKPVETLKLEASMFGFDDSSFTHYVPDGSESMEDVMARVRDFCCEHLWTSCHQDEEVLVVSHWATIKEFLKLLQPKSNGAIGVEHLYESPNTAFSRFWIHCEQEDGRAEPVDAGTTTPELLTGVHVICIHQIPHISPRQVTVTMQNRIK